MLRPQGGVYIGVGPEQNFSYIARIRPELAFIVDIRDDNRSLHLFYKALFEVAADRAEFVARLFSRERPPGLGASSTVDEIFAAVGRLSPSSARRDETARAVRERLTVDRRLPLSTDQWQSIERIISAFYTDGPAIHYGRSLPETAAGPSYVTLMTAADMWGRRRSFLASEDAFALVKDLHLRNVIVPVVGDFGSVDTLRRVTDYIRRQGATVSAFYASNVEVYLSKQQMAVFCGHLAGLPATARTWFIGSKGPRPLDVKLRSCVARS
jgi:hypothetical protein